MRLSRFQRWLGGLAVVVVTCVGAALLAATSAAAATNLVTNGDFEAGTTSGWSCGTSAAIVTTPVHGGTHALQLTPTSSDDAQCTQTVSVQPNSAYTLSDWVEGSFVFIGATGTGSTDPSTFTQAASAFTQLSVSFTTGASTTSVSVFVHGWFAQPTDVVDDVVLTGPAGTGTTPPPTNPPPSAPSAPASLHATGTTSSSVSLAWTAASGATSYNVYRNGTKVGSATSTSFTDTGLAASTTFSYAVTGVNTAGESAKSTAVSATTSAATTPPPSNTGLPAHILTGYWQDFVNGATVMRLSAVPTTYDLVAVAFANATTTPGAVSYDVDSGLSSALGGYTDANFTSDIATLHSRGQKVIISVGGANGTISVADSTSATNFANSVNSLITRFGFDGVDIDLENGVNPTFMSQALHSIAAAHPGVIITLAPQTVDMQSTGGDYFQLALDIKSILTVVNMQYYNSGTMNGCDGNVYAESTENFMTALACIQLQGGLSPSQIGLGLPASSSAAGGGVVAPSLVNNAMDCLDMGTNCGTFKPATTAPGFRGAMTWSINWDASNGFAFANTVHPHLASLR